MSAATTTATTTAPTVGLTLSHAVKDAAGTVSTTINYQQPVAEGEIRTVIPGIAGPYRINFDSQPVTIRDIRGQESDFSLDQQGFQLHRHTSVQTKFEDMDAIKNVVYPEVKELLKETTGASHVHVFSHIIRRTPWEDIQKDIEERELGDDERVGKIGPAHFAHVDQGPLGAQQLLDESLSDEEKSRLGNCRWGIINVWRPIKPVRRNPLAVCDFRSTPDQDFVPVYTRAARDYGSYTAAKMAKSYQSLAATFNPEHKWYYASSMTPDEVLLIRIFDSNNAADGTKQRTLHSAFTRPEFVGGEARESIETRCLVFWKDQAKEE